MAADKTLVGGAFKYGMSMVPKDLTKMYAQEGASITRSIVSGINNQAKRQAAKKTIDKDLKQVLANYYKVSGIGDKQFTQAGQEYFANLDWNSMNAAEREKAKADTKRMGEQGIDFSTTITNFLKNPDAYKTVEGSYGMEIDGTTGRFTQLDKEDGYKLSYGENKELMIQFKGMDKPVAWETWKKDHLKENTDEADSKFMDGLRKDVTANAKLGNDFDLGRNKQAIIQNLFKDNIDINHFANKKNFKLSDGEMGTFKDVLMTNPEAQQAIMKQIAEDPNLLQISDVDGIPGFSQSDLDMLIANEQRNKFDNSMSELVDAIVNPKNPNYDKEFAQNILGDAIAMELKQTSHKQGGDIYSNKQDVIYNTKVDAAFDENSKNADATAFDVKALNKINPKEKFKVVEKDGKMYYQHTSESIQDGQQVYIAKDMIPVDYKQFTKEYGEDYSLEDHMDNLRNFFKLRVGSKNPNIS